MHKTIKQKFNIEYKYDIFFTKNIFDIKNKLLISILNKENKNKKKVIIFIDKKITTLHKSIKHNIKKYFNKYKNNIKLVCNPIEIQGGEYIKNHYNLVKCLYKIIEKYKICRKSYIFSIGGGSIQDLMGFLSSTAHRGIKNIRIPTTTLSQDDSGVGVKNGINFEKKKNFIGSFYIPTAVINDYTFLKTLNNDLLIEGISECIKVSLIKDETFFTLIEKNFKNILNKNYKVIEEIIYNSAKLHAEHISKNGDPFEMLSSRPLDFGHWSAHKIESLSKYKISHGKAVSIGIALDSTYSYLLKLIKKKDIKRILKTLININLPIYSKELDIKKNGKNIIFDGIEEFREHLGGKLTITLIKKIGSKIDIHHVNIKIYEKAIKIIRRLNKLNKI